MASLIPGYEYDIFISYRQKDNKHDGWVTEFVRNLKDELESTFKEEISVYFDINPHDGLLETHDVDESLKQKLKCVIFIPVISRTYCDPKSFAWEHEFKAFVEMASVDQYGLKVKLTNGNVACRVLPVQIHDIEKDDVQICERVLNGHLRGVEFVYKETGVNRPLNTGDSESKNLYGTNYRNQINKVANAVKDIYNGLKIREDPGKEIKIQKDESAYNRTKKSRMLISAGILAILITAGLFFFKFLKSDPPEKSIAVLPFTNDSGNDSTNYFVIGIEEAIRYNLQSIKSFSRVLPRTTTEHFRGGIAPAVSKIARDLKVNYVVEGSILKFGNRFQLNVKLINAEKESQMWAKPFEKEIKNTSDIYLIESEIAQTIAKQLQTVITPDEMKVIKKPLTEDPEALDAYLKGEYYRGKNTKQDFETARQYYNTALEDDPSFAAVYCSLAMLYDMSSQMGFLSSSEATIKQYSAIKSALEIDSTLADVHLVLASYYSRTWNFKGYESEIRKYLEMNPNDAMIHASYALHLVRSGRSKEASDQIGTALRLDPVDPDVKGCYAHYLLYKDQYSDAVKAGLEGLKVDSTNVLIRIVLADAFYLTGNYIEALKFWKSEYFRMYPELKHDFNLGSGESDYLGALNSEADTLAAQFEYSKVNPGDIALLYSAARNKEQAMKFWEIAYKNHDNNVVLMTLPICDCLRDLPQYQALCRKMELTIN